VQFGEGAFLRGFADWMVDIANEQGLMHAGIVVVPPVRDAMADPINTQDGLYTVLLRGMAEAKPTEERRIVTSIRRAIRPHSQWQELLACFRNQPLRFVISNTTEAGIRYVEEPYRAGQCPASFPAKVAALLYERYQAVASDASQGLIFLPCELIDRNGDRLLDTVLRHAEAWNLPSAFAEWVRQGSYFLNTLVDRIVMGYPHEEAERLAGELGYADALMDAGEDFHLWVIEGPWRLASELPFHLAKLNVVWTDNLEPYRTRKIRILNGAHTAGALTAPSAGIATVSEMMVDPLLVDFLRKLVFEEVLPTIQLGETEKNDYAEVVFQRFRNPHLRHELLSISMNGVSKWAARILPSLLDSLRVTGRLPPAMAFSLAALACFYRGHRADGTKYLLRDEPAVLAFFDNGWEKCRKGTSVEALSASLLSMRTFWDADLTEVPGLVTAVATGIEAILTHGMRRAIAAIVTNG